MSAANKWRLKKFKLNPKYPHKRSDGMTHRRNRGSQWQVPQR